MSNKCSKCQVVKTPESFGANRSRPDGKDNYCKPCRSQRTSRWCRENRRQHADDEWRRRLRTTYGIDEAFYWKLLAEQGGGCAACKRQDNGKFKFMCIDHDHKTGKVRGLLCKECNVSIGMAQDSPMLLRTLADYLESKSKETMK